MRCTICAELIEAGSKSLLMRSSKTFESQHDRAVLVNRNPAHRTAMISSTVGRSGG